MVLQAESYFRLAPSLFASLSLLLCLRFRFLLLQQLIAEVPVSGTAAFVVNLADSI